CSPGLVEGAGCALLRAVSTGPDAATVELPVDAHGVTDPTRLLLEQKHVGLEESRSVHAESEHATVDGDRVDHLPAGSGDILDHIRPTPCDQAVSNGLELLRPVAARPVGHGGVALTWR